MAAAKSKNCELPEGISPTFIPASTPKVTRDLAKMDADCVAFETDYKGKLDRLTRNVDLFVP